MASVREVYDLLDEKYPYCIQEDYDNSGIMADFGKDIDCIVVSLDITNSVVEYAKEQGAQLIVSHHPVIFRPIRCITFRSPLQRLAAAGISAISAHTNFDIADGGVNDALASRLGLQNAGEECNAKKLHRQSRLSSKRNDPLRICRLCR